jgi:hypothetical protein
LVYAGQKTIGLTSTPSYDMSSSAFVPEILEMSQDRILV